MYGELIMIIIYQWKWI